MRSKKGAGIVEALMAAAVIGTVVFSLSSFFGATFQAKKRVQIRSVMEFLARSVSSRLQTPAAIFLSTLDPQGNQDLVNCLLSAGSGCDETLTTYNPARPNYFSLYYPTSQDAFEQVTSGGGEPLRYNAQGTKCTESSECVFEVRTFFYASCPSADPRQPVHSCSESPQAIHVAYQVSQITGTLREYGTSLLPPIPEKPFFFTIPSYLILGSTLNSECNAGAVLRGFDRTGNPDCKCSPPYIQRSGPGPTSNAKGPLCAQVSHGGFSCPETKVFRGFNADGTPKCINHADAYECRSLEGQDALLSGGTCGPEYWISMNNKSLCKFYCYVGKGGGSCESNEAKENRRDGMYDDSAQKIGLICDVNKLVCCKPK